MVNAISRAVRTLGSTWLTWHHIEPYTTKLFGGLKSPSMDPVIVLLSPHICWDDTLHGKSEVVRWAAAALAVPYTEEVGQNVVDVLLKLAHYDSLRLHIPVAIWRWLKKHPALPPPYNRPDIGTTSNTVCYVRGLGDIELFKSYLLLAWSDRNNVGGLNEMEDSFKEEFGGIRMWRHHQDLIEQLDHVLGPLDQWVQRLEMEPRPSSCMRQPDKDPIASSRDNYKRLKKALQNVETEAMQVLIHTLPGLCALNGLLISMDADTHRVPLNLYLCSPSPLSVIPLCSSQSYPSELCL